MREYRWAPRSLQVQWFSGRPHGTQHTVPLMAKIFTRRRKKVHEVKSRGDQTQAFRFLSHGNPHRPCLIPPAGSCDDINVICWESLLRDSALEVFIWGGGHMGAFQTPEVPDIPWGKQVFNISIMSSFTKTVQAQWLFSPDENPPRYKFPDSSQGQAMDFPKATAPGLFCTGRQDCFKECSQAVDKSVSDRENSEGLIHLPSKMCRLRQEVPQQRGWGRRWEK